MARTELAAASDLLAEAAGTADAESDRLHDLADQLETLATAERGPDHGRLARIQTALDEIQQAVDDGTAATIEDARSQLSSYRETVDGV